MCVYPKYLSSLMKTCIIRSAITKVIHYSTLMGTIKYSTLMGT